MKKLEGRVAVVTGAASGVGRAMAARFAAEGMRVVLSDVEKQPLEQAASELAAAGHAAIGVPCDVRDAESVDALRDAALREFGAVHLLCNNAGVARAPGGGYMWEFDLTDWTWLWSVNVLGVVHGIRSFVPLLLEQDDEGWVVNTTSGNGGLAPMRALPIYASTKAAVTQISECLYGQLADVTDRVGVSVLFPGPNALNTGLWNAERNRPSDLPQSRPRQTHTFEDLRSYMDGAGVSFQETPLEEIAGRVVDGIRQGAFWILPPSEHADATIRARAESMLARSNPDYMIDERPSVAGGMGDAV